MLKFNAVRDMRVYIQYRENMCAYGGFERI